MSQYRLTLDPPYAFAVEPGRRRDVNSPDFRPLPGQSVNTWRDDITGLTMLLPSHLARNYSDTFRALSGFRIAANYWRDVKRSQDQAQMFTHLPMTAANYHLIELDVAVALLAVDASVAHYDTLVWGAETLAPVVHDQGFCYHYNAIADQMLRKNNWFALQWDNAYLHFNHQGTVTAYRYNDRADLVGSGATLVDQFQICSPGDLLGKDGYFWFIPVPAYGLLVYHSHSPQKGSIFEASVGKGALRGHLIPWPTRTMPDNTLRVFETSLLRLALNPFQPNVLGFQDIVYPSSGTYADAPFDPGYKPTVVPDEIRADVIPSGHGSASAALRKPDNSGAWTAGTDRQACVQISLSTSDIRYTPFVASYGVNWHPILTTRATTPLVVAMTSATGVQDKCTRLEWSEDYNQRFEGTADLILGSAAGQAIAERDDATFLLEKSEDGIEWEIIFGGFAIDWDIKASGGMGGFYYHCTCALKDIFERFDESFRTMPHAYDDASVADALNMVLQGNGFTPMDTTNPAIVPAYVNFTKLPPLPESGGTYRFAPRVGDKSTEILAKILTFLHTQGVEWRVIYDWLAVTFKVGKRPHDKTPSAIWTLSPYSDDANAGTQTWYYAADPAPDYKGERPEANIVLVIGLTQPNTAGAGIVSDPLYNRASILDPTSPDYLGREIGVEYFFPPIGDKGELNLMARRMFDAVAHRRQKFPALHIPVMQDALVPNLHVQVQKMDHTTWVDGWIKRRTIMVDMFDRESTTLEIDSVWESEIKR